MLWVAGPAFQAGGAVGAFQRAGRQADKVCPPASTKHPLKMLTHIPYKGKWLPIPGKGQLA